MKKFLLFLLAIISLINSTLSWSQNIVINEIQSSNSITITDEDGDYSDWIEIYNYGSTSLNLSGYGLSDDILMPLKWKFPDTPIQPGQFLLVWASGKDREISGKPLHTNFKISSQGQVISLANSSGTIINSVPATNLLSDISYGRFPNGTGNFVYFGACTPGAANGSNGYQEFLNPPEFSVAGGFYTQSFSLSITTAAIGATIYYTLDGSDPDSGNLNGTTYSYKNQYPENPGEATGALLSKSFKTQKYSSLIPIDDRSNSPNNIASISSTYHFNPFYIPVNPIFKGTIVRAKVVKPGALDSPIVSKTYFVTPQGASRFSLPVVSISFTEKSFFDYNIGVYVAGVNFDNWRKANPKLIPGNTEGIGNYYVLGDNEIKANFSYFENGSEKVNQDVGIQIHGGGSRIFQSKSLGIFSRSEYGQKSIDYKFFKDVSNINFKRILLRNAGTEFEFTMFRDALCQELTKSLNCISEAYQPSVVFLNGEYWGILNVREKYDDEYFKYAFNFGPKEVDYIENIDFALEGDPVDYHNLTNYLQNNSFASSANYEYIRTRIDIESFSDFFISNIFLLNSDWPGNNVQCWRKKTNGYIANAPYGHDGRWRWALHDMDQTFGFGSSETVDFNTLDFVTVPNGPDYPNPPWSTLILRKLLENSDYRIYFINRFADLLNTNFLPERVKSTMNAMKVVLAPEMGGHISRWKTASDISQWNSYLNSQADFADKRPNIQRGHIRLKFNIDSNINVSLNVSDPSNGYIKINTINVIAGTPGILGNPYPWTGIYFRNIPIILKAIAKPGYIFDHWTGISTSTDAEIIVTPTANVSATAVFKKDNSYEPGTVIYYWLMDDKIPNNTPLVNLNSTYEAGSEGVLQYQSCLQGYPFIASNPYWRKASMERRNYPTNINYRPQINNNLVYDPNVIRGLQIKEPFISGNFENAVIFNFSTSGYKNIMLSFAAVNELSGVTGILVDYSVNPGAPVWINTGLVSSSFNLLASYQLFSIDFKNILEVNNNLNFKIRIRFTGSNLTADNGNRVTFNNIAVEGVRMAIPFSISYTSPDTFVKGTAIDNLTPNVIGGTVGNFSISPNLPDGLTIDPKTGIIAGIPTKVVSNSNYTVMAKNLEGEAYFSISISVNDIQPGNLSYNTPNVFIKNQAIANLIPTASGGTPVNFSVTPQLPNGLVLNQSTGVISGTPSQISPQTNYIIAASNSGGSSVFSISIIVNDIQPNGLSYNTPNVFTKNQAITNLIPTFNGGIPTNFSVTPQLPNGLVLNQITGVISGSPTQISPQTNFLITAVNSGGSSAFSISITVNDIQPSGLSYNTPNIFTKNQAITNLIPTVSGGEPISFSVTPQLPNGLTLNQTTGVITGTPTQISAQTNYTIRVTNSGGSSDFVISITINDIQPSDLSYNTPNIFIKNQIIANLVPTINGVTIVNFSVSPQLPDGLVLNQITGVISGAPTQISPQTNYIITAANSGGSSNFSISITVNDIQPSNFSYNTPNIFTKNQVIVNLMPTISGGMVTSFSVNPPLPSGLVLNQTTGIISGTPTQISSQTNYIITAANSGGSSTFSISIVVNDIQPTGLSYNTPNIFTKNQIITNLVPTIFGGGISSSFSVIPQLPDGLVLNQFTGVISGTPTQISSQTNYTITAANSGGSSDFIISITVNDIRPNGLSYNTPNVFIKNQAITNLVPTIAGGMPINFSVTPQLPNGLVLNQTTGVISGTPTQISPQTNYIITVANSGGSSVFSISITVNDIQPSNLSYNTPNVFIVNQTINSLIPTLKGGMPLNFSIIPQLPDGLVLDQVTGVIFGSPIQISPQTNYTVTAVNSGGSSVFNISITVNEISPTSLKYTSPNIFTKGIAIESLIPTVAGGTVENYSVVPILPLGLNLDSNSGVISGIPMEVSDMNTYTVTAQNSVGSTSCDILISVQNDLSITMSNLNKLVIYPNPFSDKIRITGIDKPFRYRLFSIEGKLIKSDFNSGN